MIYGSVAWAYQRQNRLDDAQELAVTSADELERGRLNTAARVRVWGGLLLSAATSSARMGNYEEARDVMIAAEEGADRLTRLPPPQDDGRMLSVFSRSSVRIERVRLAVQHARPDEALQLAKGVRLSADTRPRPGEPGCCWMSREPTPTWAMRRRRADAGDAAACRPVVDAAAHPGRGDRD